MPFNLDDKIVITGAAGLLGQNLITELSKLGYTNIIAIDKHKYNLDILQQLHPKIECVYADLSESGDWESIEIWQNVKCLFLLQAQITGAEYPVFEKNTVQSTQKVICCAECNKVEFTVFIGSSVVNSVADDNYTRSKIVQESLLVNATLNYCIVRPTLMFGWFDPKHLGWISRFMERTPIFPIPGSGKYIRQPLFVLDFVRVLLWCAQNKPNKAVYDIVGTEDVYYIDIIREIKKAKCLKTLIIKLPITLFRFLMNFYALFSKNPPFVADQLDALMADDYFKGVDIQSSFGIKPTSFSAAILQTFTDLNYSHVVLKR